VTTLSYDPRYQACAGKHVHRDKADAEKHARRERKRTRSVMTAYHCRYCGHWHVGHKPGSKLNREFKQALRQRADEESRIEAYQ
jgi:hypothetical protein